MSKDKMEFEYGAPIIERYGPVIRIGIEGKWVEFIQAGPERLSKKDLLDIIEEIDKQKTH